MANIFAELQMQTMSQLNTVRDTRKQLNRLMRCFTEEKERVELCEIFATSVRNLELQTMLDCDSFMIQPDRDYSNVPEDLMDDTYGMFKGIHCLFEGRYVYPVKDVYGDVMGWCGYDKFSDVKYLDSINFGYKAKNTTVWGMERLSEYYKSNRQVFFTEGIVCALYARQCGEQALATLGSGLTPYVIEIINRFGTRARILTDSDAAGNKFRNIALRNCPKARVLQSKVAKDLDDSRQVVPEIANELHKFENQFYRSRYFT